MNLIANLIGKLGSAGLLKDIFTSVEGLVVAFSHDLLVDKDVRNAAIDAVCEMLQKHKN